MTVPLAVKTFLNIHMNLSSNRYMFHNTLKRVARNVISVTNTVPGKCDHVCKGESNIDRVEICRIRVKKIQTIGLFLQTLSK